MATIKVGIIDDGYPVMHEKTLTETRIDQLIRKENWGSEESLRDLNINFLSKSLIWKKRIQLQGFNHPETYIQEKKFDCDFIVYDWEYKPSTEPDERLHEILKLTSAKIFIFSAYDKMDKIPDILANDKFKEFRHRYTIKSKGDDAEHEEIVQEVMTKFSEGELVQWEKIDITIKPSRHLIDSQDLWKIVSVLGSNFLKTNIVEQSNILDEKSIEDMFKAFKATFYIDQNRNVLSSSTNELLTSGFGSLTEISAYDALKIFGLDKLEEATEKGLTEIN